jgi:hypothetical protein
MKIKIFFVTYDNDFELNKTLKTFEDSGIKNHDYEITIVNNFTVAKPLIHTSLEVKVVDNNSRPTFSTGHLSRNWNECLIDGFGDLDNPDADIVILSQNDVEYNRDIIDTLIQSHQQYSFISYGNGDTFHSYTPNAIRSVGLWDERFCNIGWQECDYFLRQMIYNKKFSSINDLPHHRVHNKIDYQFVNIEKQSGYYRRDVHHMNSLKFHEISQKVFIKKWGAGVPATHWEDPMNQYEGSGGYRNALEITPDITVKSPQWIMYPFFENKIPNLKDKNYINYNEINIA